MYGIICNARKGSSLGIDVLALVDRSRSKRFWWTSDNANIAMCYRKKEAADFAAGRLKKNGARVVPFSEVQRVLSRQVTRIREAEREASESACLDAVELGWDGHKAWGAS